MPGRHREPSQARHRYFTPLIVPRLPIRELPKQWFIASPSAEIAASRYERARPLDACCRASFLTARRRRGRRRRISISPQSHSRSCQYIRHARRAQFPHSQALSRRPPCSGRSGRAHLRVPARCREAQLAAAIIQQGARLAGRYRHTPRQCLDA